MGRAKATLLIPVLLLATASPAPAQDAPPARPAPVTSHKLQTKAGQRSEAGGPALGSQGWWLGTGFMVVVLGAAGALCIAAKRQSGGGASIRLQVVGRVALPPRHAVYAVRAGGRTLLIGTGPQGAPALLGELDEDDPEFPSPGPARVDAASTSAPRRPNPVQSRFDVRLGDES